MNRTILLLAIAAILTGSCGRQPNILFIAIDDMNDWTGFLGGHPQAVTPNLDALAERGVNFTNAHTPAPACSPCRNALIFGVEPFHSGLYPFYRDLETHRALLDQYSSIIQLLKENGYNTYGAGKIHHGSKHEPEEWVDYYEMQDVELHYQPEFGYQQDGSRKMAFCPTRNPLKEHRDHQVADYGIRILKQQHQDPFFLAVGFHKPHLPFVCPEQFFNDLPAEITPPPINPDDLEDVGWIGRSMVRINDDYRFRGDSAWSDVRRAYLACISWTDFNAGRVLEALEESEYAGNTVVILWSDHGYHMGEKRSFRKFSLWEEATRVPFIIYDPRTHQGGDGGTCAQPVSTINIYRTICDIGGITAPGYADGYSLLPWLADPEKPVEEPAFTSWGRGNYAIRSAGWRYIRYYDGSEELYAHGPDPVEWNNLAGDPAHQQQLETMRTFLPETEAPVYAPDMRYLDEGADNPELVEERKQRYLELKDKINPPLPD